METRANYVAIGAFVMVVFLAAMGALYWLYKASEPGTLRSVRIIFPEPVTGLSTGGSVLFNGIRVGEVAQLRFAPGGGDDVIAIARIAESAPIKTDTVAKLGFQGLTGVAYISMTGGSESSQSIFAGVPEDQMPELRAQTSAFTNVLDSAQTVLRRVNSTLGEVNTFLGDNRGKLDEVVDNVTQLTSTLNQAAPQVSGLIGNLSSAGEAVANAAPQITSVVERANTILGAVEPDRVTSIVNNVDAFTGKLPELGTQAEAIVGKADGLVSRLDDAAGTVGEAVTSVRDLVEQIDGDAVGAIVANVREATGVLATRANEIGTVIDNVTAISQDLRDVSGTVAAHRDEIGTALAGVGDVITDAREAIQTVTPALKSFGEALGAVTPERVDAIVANVDRLAADFANQLPTLNSFITSATQTATSMATLTERIAARSDAIDGAVVDAAELVKNLRAASVKAPAIMDTLDASVARVGEVADAIDPEAVGALVDSARDLAGTLAGQDEQIAALIQSATSAARGIDTIATGLSGRVPQINDIIDRLDETATSVKVFAEALPEFAGTLRPGIENVSAVMAAIEPEAVEGLIANASELARTLGEQVPKIGPILTDVRETAAAAKTLSTSLATEAPKLRQMIDDAANATGKLPDLVASLEPGVQNVGTVLEALSAEEVAAIQRDVAAFAGALAAQKDNIEGLLQNTSGAAARIEAIASALAQRMPQIGAMIDSGESALASARTFADALPGFADSLQPGIDNLSSVMQAVDAETVGAIVEDAGQFADMLSSESDTIRALLSDADAAAKNANEVLATLSQKTPQISAAIDNAASAVSSIERFSATLPGFADTLRPAIDNVAEVMEALDANALRELMNDALTFASAIAQEAGTVKAVSQQASDIANELKSFITAITQRQPEVTAAIDSVSKAATSVESFAGRLPQIASSLEPGIDNVANVLQAIDPEAVKKMVADLEALAAAAGAQAPRIDGIMASVETTSRNAAEITTRLAGELDKIDSVIDNAQVALVNAREFAAGLPAMLDTLRPGIANAGEVLSAIDPEAVTAIVDNARALTDTLAQQRTAIADTLSAAGRAAQQIESVSTAVSARVDEISGIIDNASRFASSLGTAGPQIDRLMNEAGGALDAVRNTVNAVNADALNNILTNVDKVAQAVGSRTGEIGQAIDNATQAAKGLSEGLGTLGGADGTLKQLLDQAKRIGTNLEGASQQVTQVVRRMDGLLDGPVQSMVGNVSGAARSVGDVAAAFASRAGQIAGGLSRFSQGGLDDLRAVLNQGRSTLSAIETAVSSFDRDPSRVIFGGSAGPRYSPQRR
ncbi:MAG: hypothetical protein AcusKO_46250 [Acuticoccus sp.]